MGWTIFSTVNIIINALEDKNDAIKNLFFYVTSFLIGIGITHLYRYFILKYNVINFKLPTQIGIIIFFSILKAVLIFSLVFGVSDLFGVLESKLHYVYSVSTIINFSVVFLVWNLIYFSFKHLKKYQLAELNSLRYLAASRESELNNLKAQLNPHFMFNSMNCIRALIDEDPVKAKQAITKLSNILRSTLLMNDNQKIPLKDEIKLLQEYLSIEKIRYEERLNYEVEVDDAVLNCQIPPFIIQAQVENAIKHGISRLPGKGEILINAFKLGNFLKIKVSNTGKINSEKPLTGVGFKNSLQRLELLYGQAGKIFINEVNNFVVVDINIPLNN